RPGTLTTAALRMNRNHVAIVSMKNRFGTLARSWGLGVLLYRIYHAPLGWLKRCRREGPVNLLLTYRGRRLMEKAVSRLPALPQPAGGAGPEIHFLTGRKYWYQTCFCAFSMMRHAGTPLGLVVYDDGTLEANHRREMARIFPQLRFISAQEIDQRLDHVLP